MPEFEFVAHETRRQKVRYWVVADSLEEATELAERGETDNEEDVECLAVYSRSVKHIKPWK